MDRASVPDDSSVWDRMLVAELISPSQAYAVDLFLKDLAAAGAAVESQPPPSDVEAPIKEVAECPTATLVRVDGIKNMLSSECSEQSARVFLRVCSDMTLSLSSDLLQELSDVVGQCLTCLSDYYEVKYQPDPRLVARRGFLATG